MYVCIRKAISYILFALLLQSTLAAILGFPHRGFPISGIHVIRFSCVTWISQHAQAFLPLLSKSCIGPYQEELQPFKRSSSVSFSEFAFSLIHICYLLANLCEEYDIGTFAAFGGLSSFQRWPERSIVDIAVYLGASRLKTTNMIARGGCSGFLPSSPPAKWTTQAAIFWVPECTFHTESIDVIHSSPWALCCHNACQQKCWTINRLMLPRAQV